MVSFMIPIVYLILMIPLEYALELYSKYELLFLRMTFKEEKDKNTKIRHRIAVLCTCGGSVRRILAFPKAYVGKMYVGMKEAEFDNLIFEFSKAYKDKTHQNDVWEYFMLDYLKLKYTSTWEWFIKNTVIGVESSSHEWIYINREFDKIILTVKIGSVFEEWQGEFLNKYGENKLLDFDSMDSWIRTLTQIKKYRIVGARHHELKWNHH